MTITNPHTQTVHNAMIRFKELASTLDGWNFTSETNGVKLYNKSDDTAFLIVRGDVVAGKEYTARQVAAVANSPGCRKIWDDKFDAAELREMYSVKEALFWSKVKTPWPISPRDLSAATLREFTDEDLNYTVMTSVQDPKVPEVSGCVRSNLYISGWKIYKTDAGVAVTYITQVDLAGSIPSSFLKGIQRQVPLCAGSVLKYLEDYGFPPTVEELTADVKSEHFDHSTKEYTAEVFGSGIGKWLISDKMYPAGIKVNISGNAKHEIVDGALIVTGIDGPTTIRITKA